MTAPRRFRNLTREELEGLELEFARFLASQGMPATEWARDTGAVTEVPDRGGGSIRVPQSPWRFSEGPTGVTGEPRYRGEDNRRLLTAIGYSDADIDRLEADGTLSSRIPDR
mgnify:CR=1 FL=1